MRGPEEGQVAGLRGAPWGGSTRSMPVDLATLRTVGRLAVAKRPPTLRRVRAYAGFPAVFASMRAVTELGRRLDGALYRDYRHRTIERPTFIFANARSGTTLLHRLMSLDSERFAPFKLYETLFPAIVWRRLVEAAGRLDAPLGGRLSRAVDWIDGRYLSGWNGIHELGLGKEEEDEQLFLYPLVSPALSLLFPDVDELVRVNWLDRMDEPTRQRVMDYYDDAIKRHLYASGGNRELLNKNVLFTGRVMSVYERWPDARFIYLLRHPYQAIPSFLSMFYVAWAAHSPDIRQDGPEIRALAQLAVDYYRYALECRDRIPHSQFLVVRYDDLVADPRATVLRLYEDFGIEPSAAFRSRLEEATREARSFRSAHDYSLEQFGLTRGWIADQLRPMMDEFGFEA